MMSKMLNLKIDQVESQAGEFHCLISDFWHKCNQPRIRHYSYGILIIECVAKHHFNSQDIIHAPYSL